MEGTENVWKTALWRQLGAAIDMLDRALEVCPASLWTRRVWDHPPTAEFPAWFSEFWSVGFHAVKWLDRYLSNVPEQEFAPSAPLARGTPERPNGKEELRAYLASTRRRCQRTLMALTDEEARRPVSYFRPEGQAISFFELQLVNLRHVQEHATQLSLFLGQHGVPDADLDWVARGASGCGGR